MIAVCVYTTFFFHGAKSVGELYVSDFYKILLIGAGAGLAVALLLAIPQIELPNGINLGLIGVFLFGLFTWLYIDVNIFGLAHLGDGPIGDVHLAHFLTIAWAVIAILGVLGYIMFRIRFFEKSSYIIVISYGLALFIMYTCFIFLFWDRPLGKLGTWDLLSLASLGVFLAGLELIVIKLAKLPFRINLASLGVVIFALILWLWTGVPIEVPFLFWRIQWLGNVHVGEILVSTVLIMIIITGAIMLLFALVLEKTVGEMMIS